MNSCRLIELNFERSDCGRLPCSSLVLIIPFSMFTDGRPDSFIQKTKKLYKDSTSLRNLNKVSSDLKDVTRLLQQNIDDVLQRGAKIERTATFLSITAQPLPRDISHVGRPRSRVQEVRESDERFGVAGVVPTLELLCTSRRILSLR